MSTCTCCAVLCCWAEAQELGGSQLLCELGAPQLCLFLQVRVKNPTSVWCLHAWLQPPAALLLANASES